MDLNLNLGFSSFYELYKDKPLVFLTHRHADLDSFVSAYVLSKIFPHSVVAVYEDMNSAVNNLVRTFHLKYQMFNGTLKENIVLVDTRSKGMAPENIKPLAAIDHHAPSPFDFKVKYLFYKELAATAELVYFIYKELGKQLDNLSKNLLAVAIISDTARFKKADPHTFSIFKDLLTWKYEDALKLAFPERPKEEKLSISGGLVNAQFCLLGEKLIAYTEVVSEEGTTATILSEIADVVIVARRTKEGCRISLRTSTYTSIRADELAQTIAKKLNGKGGGHPKAAGCSLPTNPQEGINAILNNLEKLLT